MLLDEADLPAGTFVLLPELGDTGFSFDLERHRRRPDAAVGPFAGPPPGASGCRRGTPSGARTGRGRNCATIVAPDGSVVGTYRKVHPFSYGREAEHFGGGDALLVTRCGDAVVAPQICYDLRFPELWRHAALAGAELFTIGASWPAARQQHWRHLLVARAIENQAFVLAVQPDGRGPSPAAMPAARSSSTRAARCWVSSTTGPACSRPRSTSRACRRGGGSSPPSPTCVATCSVRSGSTIR